MSLEAWMEAGKDGVEAAFVKTNGDGLTKSFVGKKLLSAAPFDRLEKRVGSTFSKSSPSTASEALRFPAGLTGIAVARCQPRDGKVCLIACLYV
jgi:hypothetical protein